MDFGWLRVLGRGFQPQLLEVEKLCREEWIFLSVFDCKLSLLNFNKNKSN